VVVYDELPSVPSKLQRRLFGRFVDTRTVIGNSVQALGYPKYSAQSISALLKELLFACGQMFCDIPLFRPGRPK
jgi:hypothetical protein